MMSDYVWNSFKNIFSHHGRLDDLLDALAFDAVSSLNGEWAPPVDIYENENEVIITAEIPGMARDEINIHVDNNILKITGEKKAPFNNKEENIYRLECPYGKFKRVFNLGNRIDKNKITANYKEGILKVILPKDNTTKQKRIEIIKES
jgi:HSP20 family protein